MAEKGKSHYTLTNTDSGPTPLATFVVSVLFTTLSIIVVALRIFAARRAKRSFRWHDYLVFIALINSIGGCISVNLGIRYGGIGRHSKDVSPNEKIIQLRILLAIDVFWVTSSALVKASFLSLLHELFPRKFFRRAIYVFYFFVLAFWIAFVIEPFLICRPYPYEWDFVYDYSAIECGDQWREFIVSASINMVLDLGLVILPMFVIWELQLSLVKKLRLSIIFSLGLIICALNIARVVWTATWTHLIGNNQGDVTYSAAIETILAQMEVWVGIIAACLPTLAPLVKRRGSRTRDDTPQLSLISSQESYMMKRTRNSSLSLTPGTTLVDERSPRIHGMNLKDDTHVGRPQSLASPSSHAPEDQA